MQLGPLRTSICRVGVAAGLVMSGLWQAAAQALDRFVTNLATEWRERASGMREQRSAGLTVPLRAVGAGAAGAAWVAARAGRVTGVHARLAARLDARLLRALR